MSQWTSPGRIVTGLVSAAAIVVALVSMSGTQRAQSLGLTQHGALITAQDAGAADAVAAVAVTPGTVGQVLTVSDAGLPHWAAAAAGGSAVGSGTYAARPASPAAGDIYVVTSGARRGSVYRATSASTWGLLRVASPVSGEAFQLDAEQFDGSATGAWVTAWRSETGPVALAITQSNLHTVLTSAAGGLPGVTFGSTAPGIRVPWMGPTGASPRAMAVVLSRVIAEGNSYAHVAGWGSSSANTLFAMTVRTGGANVMGAHWWGSALTSAVAPATGATPSLYLLQYDGATATLYVDGTLAASGAVSLNTGTAAGLTLGLNPPALNEAARHTLHGLVVWGRALDSTERSALRVWSQDRWGTP